MPRLALILSLCMCCVGAVAAWYASARPEPEVATLSPRGKVEVGILQQPSNKPPRWAALVTRPLFSPTRRPFVPPPEPEPEPELEEEILPEPEIFIEAEPEPEPEVEVASPPPPELTLIMRGAVILPSKRMALFLDTSENREVSLSVGDTLRDWNLVEISARKSVFIHGDVRRELLLPTPKN